MDKKTNDFMTALRDQIAARDAAQDAQLADIMTGKAVAVAPRPQPANKVTTQEAPAKKARKKAVKKAPKA